MAEGKARGDLAVGLTEQNPNLLWAPGVRAGDEVFEDHGLRILVDGPSLPYVKGAVVDYVESMQGAGFKVDNPNVIAACGCGSSFRVADEEEVSAV